MNPAAHHRASLAHGSQRGGNQRSGGRKNNRGIQFLGRTLVRCACPYRAQAFRKALRLFIAAAREGVHAAALMAGHLRDDVGRGAEDP